ncbi:hypothetical protein M8C21_019393, partial [Ambrosia artemisiifolia]
SESLSKPSSITGWLNSVTSKRSVSSSSTVERVDSVSSSQLDAAMDELRGLGESRDAEVEEEYQIQLALELSAREDPEAAQIEAVKQISLVSLDKENTPAAAAAEIVAFRYWNYSALSYDDKILDGFYDLYGVLTGPTSSKMPSLVDLQATPVSDNVAWEAVLVNKASDSKLLGLEQTALEMTVKSMSESINFAGQTLVQRLAVLVSDHMGGPVGDPEKMSIAWRDFCSKLKESIGSMVLPLGSLNIGLARHRALLFKVLADSVGIPCRLVKGKQYTGSSSVAMNFIKLNDGREYIVDLMADPGTLIPSDTAAGLNLDYEESFSSSPWSRDEDSSSYYLASSTSNFTTSSIDYMEENDNTHSSGLSQQPIKSTLEPKQSLPPKVQKDKGGSSQHVHARSPSWTEGISSPAVRKLKVKDVSQYMMEAAKENPQLAQKLHDVLLESGVVAPPDLFTQIYEDELPSSTTESLSQPSQPRFLPPLPHPTKASSQSEGNPVQYVRNVPAAAAAAAAAAAVASSMVVAATKTITDQNIQLPVAAAATVTAAVMVATTTAISGNSQSENSNVLESPRNDGDTGQHEIRQEGERVSDRSTGNESTVSEVSLEDVADCEIAWEDITLGERIGLGSYGEVYRGDWHGTDVAVKKFLDQEITTESLEEFRSEARGMNYLHNCTPVIVHRDLKSPNLLVDKNWVV